MTDRLSLGVVGRLTGRSVVLWISGVLLVALAGCQQAPVWRGTAVPAAPAPALEGTNWDGEPFRLADLEGRAAVVFFGYTMCPDVCPLALHKMKQVVSGLGEQGGDVAVVFVSVDPHRDTLEKISGYVPNFNQEFYGVRLEFDELEVVQEAWDVTVQYGQPKDGPGTDSFYYVDHTGTYFVLDRQGNLRLEFPPNASADDLKADLEVLLDA